MNRYHLLTVGLLILSLDALAQSSTTAIAAAVRGNDSAGLPSVEAQLHYLTEKLGLTAHQGRKIKPILQRLHDATETLAEDSSLSSEERLAKVRPLRYEADRSMRAMLSADQRKRLDAYERGPHPEMHGNITGVAAASSRSQP